MHRRTNRYGTPKPHGFRSEWLVLTLLSMTAAVLVMYLTLRWQWHAPSAHAGDIRVKSEMSVQELKEAKRILHVTKPFVEKRR